MCESCVEADHDRLIQSTWLEHYPQHKTFISFDMKLGFGCSAGGVICCCC
jgi:hypothetical protein